MKGNIKFFTLVSSLLLVSMLVLAGCMYAIAAKNGERKPYNLNGQKINFASSGGNIVEGDAPLAQASMQAKFEAMYDISGDGKSITVISKDYLDGFWLSNYEKEVIHSLTVEEVYYIIQDSLRVYYEYETVILPGFGSVSSVKEVADRFPFVEAQEICTDKASGLERDKVISDIRAIIMYRLTVLSSPKAFFTGAEAIIYCGGEPAAYNGMYPETIFYIPDYSEKTDRDYILSIMGGTTNFTDLERFSDLFVVSSLGVEFSSISNGSTTKVFPIDDILLTLLSGCKASKNPSGNGKEPSRTDSEIGKCIAEENGKYMLTLPKSGEKIELEEEHEMFVPYITDALVEAAEDKITQKIAESTNHSFFYLQITEDYLCLTVEVIKKLDSPAASDTSGDEAVQSGCGNDHEHIFYSERISARALRKAEDGSVKENGRLSGNCRDFTRRG